MHDNAQTSILNERVTNTHKGANSVFLFAALASCLGILLILALCEKGFDLTDEGYYLSSIRSYKSYKLTITQFGFVYSPILELLGGSIAGLRRANLITIFSLSWLAASLIIKERFGVYKLSKIQHLCVSASIALSSLWYLRIWLPTPSYNSLNLQSLLIVFIGVLLSRGEGKKLIGWAIVGFGVWLSMMAKPSTTLAVSFLIGMYWIVTKPKVTDILIAPIVTATLGIVAAVAIDGSPTAFVHRLNFGSMLAKTYDPNYSIGSIFRLGRFPLYSSEIVPLICLFSGLIFAVGISSVKGQRQSHKIDYVFGSLFLGSAIISGYQLMQEAMPEIVFSFAAPTLILALLTHTWFTARQTFISLPSDTLGLLLFSICLPYCYAFGTFNDYWQTGSMASIFLVFSALQIVSFAPSKVHALRILGWLLVFATTLTMVMLRNSIRAPYRQTEMLTQQSHLIHVGPDNSELLIAGSIADLIRVVTVNLQNAGFEANTPMLDLSARFPGLIFAVGGQAVGQAWLLGDRPGSYEVAKSVLTASETDKLKQTWIITGTGLSDTLPPEILGEFGLNLESDFKKVLEVDVPNLYKGNPEDESRLHFWAPI